MLLSTPESFILSLKKCSHSAITNILLGWVSWPDPVTWPDLIQNFTSKNSVGNEGSLKLRKFHLAISSSLTMAHEKNLVVGGGASEASPLAKNRVKLACLPNSSCCMSVGASWQSNMMWLQIQHYVPLWKFWKTTIGYYDVTYHFMIAPLKHLPNIASVS